METLPLLQAPPPDASVTDEIDLRRLWQTITRSAWVIVTTSALAVMAAAVAVQSLKPTYEAAATVRIDDPRKDMMSPSYWGPDYQTLLATSTELLTSRSLAMRVVDSLGLRLGVVEPRGVERGSIIAYSRVDSAAPDGVFVLRRQGGMVEVRRPESERVLGMVPDSGLIPIPGGMLRLAPGAPAEVTVAVGNRLGAADAMRSNVVVDQVSKAANVLKVSYRGTDQALVRDVPNVLVTLFVQQRIGVGKAEARQRVQFYKKQVDTLNIQLESSSQAASGYLQALGISSIESRRSTLENLASQYRSKKIDLETARSALTWGLRTMARDTSTAAMEQMINDLIGTRVLTAGTTAVGSADFANYLPLLIARDSLRTRRSRTDPDFRELESRVRDARLRLMDRAAGVIASMGTELAALDQRADSLNALLIQMPVVEAEYNRLGRNRAELLALLQDVQQRMTQADLEASVEDSSATMVDAAVTPQVRVGTSKTSIYAIAVFSGLLVGVAVAFLRDWLDTTVRSERDLERITGVPVIGIIPNLREQAALQYRLRAAVGGDGRALGRPMDYHASAAEAYRVLRTNLNYLTPNKPPRVLVVTSALPGDGKTTTVVNLAVTLAHQGQRVLLVDGETRRGTVHEVFGIQPAPGFFDLLYGQASPGECIRRVAMEGGGSLDVMPLGSTPSVNPADLLVTGRLQPLFDRLRAQYDFVLIDTPPLNLFTDAALMGAQADALMIVARSDRTDREELQFAVTQLRNVSVPLAAAVLNDVEMRRASRYRGGYSYYYAYGSGAPPEPAAASEPGGER